MVPRIRGSSITASVSCFGWEFWLNLSSAGIFWERQNCDRCISSCVSDYCARTDSRYGRGFNRHSSYNLNDCLLPSSGLVRVRRRLMRLGRRPQCSSLRHRPRHLRHCRFSCRSCCAKVVHGESIDVAVDAMWTEQCHEVRQAVHWPGARSAAAAAATAGRRGGRSGRRWRSSRRRR